MADPLDRMTAATRAYLEFFQDHPGLVELFIQERAEFGSRKKPIYFEHEGSACAQWHDLIQGLIDAGRIRDISVDRVKETIGDLLYGTMFTNHMVGRRRPFEEQAASLMDVFFNGILSDSERASRLKGRVGIRDHAEPVGAGRKDSEKGKSAPASRNGRGQKVVKKLTGHRR